MRKLIFILSLPLLSVSLARLFDPSLLFGFASLDPQFAILGLLVTLTALYLTSPAWEQVKLGGLLLVGALCFLGFTIFAIASPTLLGERATYMPIMDSFITLEGSILLAVAATQKKHNALSLVAAVGVIGQLLLRRLRSAAEARNVPLRTFYHSSS